MYYRLPAVLRVMVIERLPLRKPEVPGHNATFHCLWITSGGQYASSPMTRELYGFERWHVYKVTLEEPCGQVLSDRA